MSPCAHNSLRPFGEGARRKVDKRGAARKNAPQTEVDSAIERVLARRRPAIYYGWYIVLGATVAQFVAAGTQAYVSGVFLKAMTEDLGWSRGGFSAVQTVSTFSMGVVGFAIGGLIDRRGPRLLMLAGTAICGVSLMLTSFVNEMWQFYLVRGVAQTVGNAMLGNIVVNVTLAKWFVVRRGMAIAVASAGVSLGGVILTPSASWWVDAYGWRSAWVALGVMAIVLMVPISLLMRRSPEDSGLLPDGMTEAQATAYSASHRRASAASEVQWTRHDAIRTKTIWLVIFAYGIANVGLGAILLHTIPFLTDSGFSGSSAAFLYGVLAWAALLSKFAWGLLMDRYHARFLSAAAFFAMAAASLVLIPVGHSGSGAGAFAVLLVYGLAMGGTIPLQETVWASYFGRAHLGQIRAVAMPFTIVFSAGGPLFAGAVYDRTGNYDVAFVAFAAFALIGFVLVLLARAPRPPRAESALAEPLPGQLAAT